MHAGCGDGAREHEIEDRLQGGLEIGHKVYENRTYR